MILLPAELMKKQTDACWGLIKYYIRKLFTLKYYNMKKIFLPVIAMLVLAACGGSDSNSATTEKKPEAPKDPAYEKGLALVGTNDCLTCHKINEPFTGPSYKQVAEKYAGASGEKITELAKKVISGGTGVWGSAMMTPHASVSQEDAEAMVKYILLLNK